MNASTETGTATKRNEADEARHRSAAELEAALPRIREAPVGDGIIQLIVRRPAEDQREVLHEARINDAEGVEGDTWNQRGTSLSADGGPHPNKQITIMNSRAAEAVIGPIERWPLAGDQIYADLDISHEALPAGTQMSIGTAVVEVAVEPHTGCAKFAARFGREALRFVNTGEGSSLRLRGVNCRVIQPGTVKVGDTVTQI